MFILPIPMPAAKPIKLSVGGTNIFARARGDAQALIYGMNITASDSVAMVLPLPTPPGVGEDAVRFVDLSGYANVFVDLNECFPPVMPPMPRGGGGFSGGAPVKAVLQVHEAGDFEASFVPTIEDIDRIDPRFRLPEGIWDALPQYRDWSFAVFQLRDVAEPPRGLRRVFGGLRPKTIHPMALEFPRRFTDRLFFPTVHLHDGTVHPHDAFDHALFWQQNSADANGRFWSQTPTYTTTLDTVVTANEHVDIEAARGLIDGESRVYRQNLAGLLPNQDHWVLTGSA